MNEVKLKVLNGDMPLHKLDYVVDIVLSEEGIDSGSSDAYSKEVLKWLEQERTDSFIFNILGAAIPIGLALACFIPGIGIAAVIALGSIGAGVGAAFAGAELEFADDLNDAGNASGVGSQKFVDEEAARKEYAWAIVTAALSLLDIAIATRAIGTLVKVSKATKGIAGANDVIKLLDEKTLRNLAKLDSEDMIKVLKVSNDPTEAAGILKNINKVDDLKLISQMDYSNLSGKDIAIVRQYPEPPAGYEWVKSGDDVTIQNKPENDGDLIFYDPTARDFIK